VSPIPPSPNTQHQSFDGKTLQLTSLAAHTSAHPVGLLALRASAGERDRLSHSNPSGPILSIGPFVDRRKNPRIRRESNEKENPFRRPTRRTQLRPIGWGVGRHVCNLEGPPMSRDFVVNQGRPSDSGVRQAFYGDEYHRPTRGKLRSFPPHRDPHSDGPTPCQRKEGVDAFELLSGVRGSQRSFSARARIGPRLNAKRRHFRY
jgi:hypothetical protein